jgi:hypothetical protein
VATIRIQELALLRPGFLETAGIADPAAFAALPAAARVAAVVAEAELGLAFKGRASVYVDSSWVGGAVLLEVVKSSYEGVTLSDRAVRLAAAAALDAVASDIGRAALSLRDAAAASSDGAP